MNSAHPAGHTSRITTADLHDALADLLAAVLTTHPDPIHAAYPPIARAIALLQRYDEQQHRDLSSEETHTV